MPFSFGAKCLNIYFTKILQEINLDPPNFWLSTTSPPFSTHGTHFWRETDQHISLLTPKSADNENDDQDLTETAGSSLIDTNHEQPAASRR